MILCAPGGLAWADVDIARLTMGRTTYPQNSWTVDIFSTQIMPDIHDQAKDIFWQKLQLEHGYTDRLSLGAGVKTKRAERDFFTADRLILQTRYLMIKQPLQLTPFIGFLPSLRGSSSEWEFGFEALKNQGPWSVLVHYEGELKKEPNGKMEIESSVFPGIYYRFGLNGIGGVEWHYTSNGAHAVHGVLGGRVSKNIFLAIQQHFGLTKQSPDIMFTLQLNFYFGPQRLGGWEL